jgi:hypothetical protein
VEGIEPVEGIESVPGIDPINGYCMPDILPNINI